MVKAVDVNGVTIDVGDVVRIKYTTNLYTGIVTKIVPGEVHYRDTNGCDRYTKSSSRFMEVLQKAAVSPAFVGYVGWDKVEGDDIMSPEPEPEKAKFIPGIDHETIDWEAHQAFCRGM